MSLLLFLTAAAWGQTLGSTLESVGTETGTIVSRYQNASSWGEKTAVEDLKRLVTVSHQLTAAFSGQDARQVENLQRDLMTAARRVGTSSVLLPDSEQPKIQEIVNSVGDVDERLTELRLRFGSKANLVPGSLADVSLESAGDGMYTNIQDLLIDVRYARELVQSLRVSRTSPFGYGYGFGTGPNGPNAIDSLQLRRAVQASWEFQRTLQGQVADVSESYQAWRKFEREYNRLGYIGSGRVVTRLERVMGRLGHFYDKYDGEFGKH